VRAQRHSLAAAIWDLLVGVGAALCAVFACVDGLRGNYARATFNLAIVIFYCVTRDR
jgi:hypothetical protein